MTCENDLWKETLKELKKQNESLQKIVGVIEMPRGRKGGLDTPITIFLVVGLYLLFTGKDSNSQILGLILTGIGLLSLLGQK